MARFSVNDAEKFGGQGGGGFFRLVDDKDTARVRFLYNGIDDVEGFAVHQIEIDGKKRYVNCLREYGAPVDDCPFCAKGMFTTAKYFIPLYNIDEDRVQIWERGKQFGSKLSSMCARYSNLVSHTFEIERCGKKGDTNTTYEIYETGADENVSVDDFDMPNILGGFVLDKSADDMDYFNKHGDFPSADGASDDAPIRRRSSSSESRRTPSNRGDAF